MTTATRARGINRWHPVADDPAEATRLRREFTNPEHLPARHCDWAVVVRLLDGQGYDGIRDGHRGPTPAEVLAAARRRPAGELTTATGAALGIEPWKVAMSRRWGTATRWREHWHVTRLVSYFRPCGKTSSAAS